MRRGADLRRLRPPRRRRWRWALIAVALVALPLAVLGILTLGGGVGSRGGPMPDEGQHHVPEGTTVAYGHAPPTSGPHWPNPARWGVHDEPVPPERWVHNLEHGGLVILYNCPTGCPELVDELRRLHATFPPSKWGHVKLLVTPYPELRTPLAILAWAWLEELDRFDEARLLGIYQTRVDQGPEDLP